MNKHALERVRNKLLDGIGWYEPTPSSLEAFSTYAASVLSEEDFRVLDELEDLIGEQPALAWLDAVMREAATPVERRAA
jgi:hypothetical protein